MKKLISFLVLFSVVSFLSDAFSKEVNYLKQGVEQYKQENYEEAIEILLKARKESPESSPAAFFLGLAYKQAMNYPQAVTHLEDAATLAPKIKEAVVELIDVLYQLGKLPEARKWIQVAEEEEVSPAKVAFLKGLVLQKEGKNLEAIESFEKAKNLDSTLTQSSEFQSGLCYLRERKLKAAKERFHAAVLYDSYSDLAGFARQYLDIVEKRIEVEKPFRLTASVFYQYDDNVILMPGDSLVAAGITGEESASTVSTVRLDYMPTLPGPWLFNAQYAFYSNAHRHNATTHDVIGNTISIAPGYNFGQFTLNLLTRYSHSLVHNQRYMGSFEVGPLFRTLLNRNHILEYFIGYNEKEYFEPIGNFSVLQTEDRDSTGFNTYLSWIWLFKKDAFFNLKYEFIKENTEGENWENYGHRFTVNAAIPLMNKLKLQMSGEALLQDFRHTHTWWFPLGATPDKRDDDTYTASVGFTYNIFKNANLITQYTRVRCDSNLAPYDYSRDIYTAGIEYRF